MKKLIFQILTVLLLRNGDVAWADAVASSPDKAPQSLRATSSINVDEAKKTGSLTSDQIAKVIAEYMGQIEYCYERQLQKEPTLRGEIRVHFVIDKLGKVATASTMSSTMKSPVVESCINGVFRRMPFPAFEEGFVEATYPLLFNLSETPGPNVEKIVERGQPAPKPVDVEQPQVAPIKNEIAKVIQASMHEFNGCYEHELKNNPTLMGKVIVWAVIDPKGNVTNVTTKFTSLGSLTVELCLNYQFSKLKFPNAADNKIIEVNYPFSFGLPKK